MTQLQIVKYRHFAAISAQSAGFDLVTVDPVEDYVEAICCKCNKIGVFRGKDFNHFQCDKCRTIKQKYWYQERSQQIVENAGFKLSYISYEEDYIEVECPDCNRITSFYFKELSNIYCRLCLIKNIAEAKGFVVHTSDDLPDELEDLTLDEFTLCGNKLLLVCKKCKRWQIFDCDAENAVEKVKKTRCPCALMPRLKRIATNRGFSIEQQSSPFGYYSLSQNEIALICNRCGEEIILDLQHDNLVQKIKLATCKNKDCVTEDDYIALTRHNDMAWCCDALCIISIVNFTQFNCYTIANGCKLAIPEDGNKEIYFAIDPKNKSTALIFVVYPDEEDAWLSKYLLFTIEISNWGNAHLNATALIKNPDYYIQLYRAITQNISASVQRPAKITDRTFDGYICAYNSMCYTNSELWDMSHMLSALNSLKKFLEQKVDNKINGYPADPQLQQFLKSHTCPICGKIYMSTETTCSQCDFPGLNHKFVDLDEEEYWDTHIVTPFKQKYQARMKSAWTMKMANSLLNDTIKKFRNQ